jgi:DnaJ-domain-containing protein 1
VTLFLGIAAVAILWWLLSSFTQSNPAAVAKVIRRTGGLFALGAAVLLGMRGRIDMALLLGSLGFWLLGWSGLRFPRLDGLSQRSSGRISRVRSALLEMELNHDTGEMDGSVLVGTFAGRRLHALDRTDLLRLLTKCHESDSDGVRLLEAYLDRRYPDWRTAGQNDEQTYPGTRPTSGAMTPEEAYQILGLQPGAGPDEVRQAHRTLMKKLHPDQGGSTYLAARGNLAKEILLDRHG